MKHKHCELIKDWADGKQIQIYDSGGGWVDLESPFLSGSAKYRIKPETLKYRVALLRSLVSPAFAASVMMQSSADSLETDNKYFVRWLTDWQEVEV